MRKPLTFRLKSVEFVPLTFPVASVGCVHVGCTIIVIKAITIEIQHHSICHFVVVVVVVVVTVVVLVVVAVVVVAVVVVVGVFVFVLYLVNRKTLIYVHNNPLYIKFVISIYKLCVTGWRKKGAYVGSSFILFLCVF